MKVADEELGAACTKASRDSGFTGLNQLAILSDLYGFDLLYESSQKASLSLTRHHECR